MQWISKGILCCGKAEIHSLLFTAKSFLFVSAAVFVQDNTEVGKGDSSSDSSLSTLTRHVLMCRSLQFSVKNESRSTGVPVRAPGGNSGRKGIVLDFSAAWALHFYLVLRLNCKPRSLRSKIKKSMSVYSFRPFFFSQKRAYVRLK